jgi:hypothetical protein
MRKKEKSSNSRAHISVFPFCYYLSFERLSGLCPFKILKYESYKQQDTLDG